AVMGVDGEHMREAVGSFTPLAHRVEQVGVARSVTFIDDSKATNVDAAKRAIEAIRGKIILIAGGRDKEGDYSPARDLIASKVKKMILIGEAAGRIREAFQDIVDIELSPTLEDATGRAFNEAREGDTVLLSPMCSSFDMFRDYKHRGDVFKAAALEIIRRQGSLQKG
ncbi:MAG: cyanophycin synthetase, partial [Candidatus Omnitrophota bacterium]